MKVFILLFLIYILPIVELSDLKRPFVKSKKGILEGEYEISRNGIKYETYIGITYGKINKRFQESVPVENWSGIKNASEFGIHCTQPSLFENKGTGIEDCLTLNIFTPKGDDRKRSVLVYIHGGGFTFGSSSEYGGDFLIDEDIVLVTINYRLGLLGFLNSGDGLINGNLGLKDQVLGLKWIHENINEFGGDNKRITVSGNSAGGASVNYLITSPLSQGLFKSGICFSGTFLNPWAFMDNSINEIKQIAQYLKCPKENTQEIIKCLENKDTNELMEAQKSLARWAFDLLRFVPSIEIKNKNNPNPFLDESPQERIKKTNYKNIPLMLTMTPEEGLLIYSGVIINNEELLGAINKDCKNLAPIMFEYEKDKNLKYDIDYVSTEIHKYYFGGKPLNAQTQNNLTNLFTDTHFMRGIIKTGLNLGKDTPVFLGLFTQSRNDFSPLSLFGIKDQIQGVTNTAELSYLFSKTKVPGPMPVIGLLKDSKDIEFSKKFVKLIGNFVKKGKPNSDEWNPISKDEINSESLNWFNIGENDYFHVNPFEDRIKFWKEMEISNKDEL